MRKNHLGPRKSHEEILSLEDTFREIEEIERGAEDREKKGQSGDPSSQIDIIGEQMSPSGSLSEEYENIKTYLEHLSLLDPTIRISSAEKVYESFMNLSQRVDNLAFQRACLILAGRAAEMRTECSVESPTESLKWTLAAYEARKQAYESAKDSNDEEAHSILSFLVNSSKRAFELSQGLEQKIWWAERSFEERSLVGEKVELNGDLKHAGYILSYAGNMAEELSNLVEGSERILWLKKGYEVRDRSARDSELAGNIVQAFHVYTFAANMAKKAGDLVEDSDEKTRLYIAAFKRQAKAGELSREINSKHSMHCFSFAAALAEQIMVQSKTQKEQREWGHYSYKYGIISAEISKGTNEKHHSAQLSRLGNMAYKLSRIDKNEALWVERSYGLGLKSANLMEELGNSRGEAYNYRYVAKNARTLARLSQGAEAKLEWWKKAVEAQSNLSRLGENSRERIFLDSHLSTADDALKVSQLSEDPQEKVSYLERAYEYGMKSERLTVDSDQRHARTSFCRANEAAKILRDIHPDSTERERWGMVFRDGIRELREKYG